MYISDVVAVLGLGIGKSDDLYWPLSEKKVLQTSLYVFKSVHDNISFSFFKCPFRCDSAWWEGVALASSID